MGFAGYWTCLTAVAARVPSDRHSGLTGALLANEAPGRRTFLSAAATAGGLALILAVLAGLHYYWAQGPSSLARYLEQTGAAGDPSPPPRALDR
jgi:hypothetical protein